MINKEIIKVKNFPSFKDFENKIEETIELLKNTKPSEFLNILEKLDDKKISQIFCEILVDDYNDEFDDPYEKYYSYEDIKKYFHSQDENYQNEYKEEFINRLIEFKIFSKDEKLRIKLFNKDKLKEIFNLETQLTKLYKTYSFEVGLFENMFSEARNNYCEIENPYLRWALNTDTLTIVVHSCVFPSFIIDIKEIGFRASFNKVEQDKQCELMFDILEQFNQAQNHIEFVFEKKLIE